MSKANPTTPQNTAGGPAPAAGAPVAARTGRTVLDRGDEDTGMAESALLMGIDLGTSRSSIVSMTGQRKTVESYVGFPRDAVSRKYFKTDVVYGKAALDNRLALDLYRPLEKGVIKGTLDDSQDVTEEHKKNLHAAKILLRHLVEIVDPGRDDVLYGVIGVPARATLKNKQAILEIAKEVLDSVMIVSEPFTVAYGLSRMSDVLVIDIGAGTTDLCRMHGTVPADEDQLSFQIAGDGVDTKLLDLIKQRYPEAQVTQNMCKQFKELYGFVSDTKDRVVVTIPVAGKPTPHDITDQLRQACELLVQPILDAIHELIKTFDPEFQDRLRNNIILSGGGGLLRGLNKRIEDGLAQTVGSAHVSVVEEPLYAGATGALQLALDMPAEYWQQLR
jgi:rod shape-determining protein MreB